MGTNRRRAAADLYEQALQTLEDAQEQQDWELVQAVVLALREWIEAFKPAPVNHKQTDRSDDEQVRSDQDDTGCRA